MHFLIQFSIEECIIDIELVKRPIVRGNKCKKTSHNGEFRHMRECFIVI
jgi:hypothetical protein